MALIREVRLGGMVFLLCVEESAQRQLVGPIERASTLQVGESVELGNDVDRYSERKCLC
jgi:hypothetical protein